MPDSLEFWPGSDMGASSEKADHLQLRVKPVHSPRRIGETKRAVGQDQGHHAVADMACSGNILKRHVGSPFMPRAGTGPVDTQPWHQYFQWSDLPGSHCDAWGFPPAGSLLFHTEY